MACVDYILHLFLMLAICSEVTAQYYCSEDSDCVNQIWAPNERVCCGSTCRYLNCIGETCYSKSMCAKSEVCCGGDNLCHSSCVFKSCTLDSDCGVNGVHCCNNVCRTGHCRRSLSLWIVYVIVLVVISVLSFMGVLFYYRYYRKRTPGMVLNVPTNAPTTTTAYPDNVPLYPSSSVAESATAYPAPAYPVYPPPQLKPEYYSQPPPPYYPPQQQAQQ